MVLAEPRSQPAKYLNSNEICNKKGRACDGSKPVEGNFKLTGVRAVLVTVTVVRGVRLRQRHTEEISAAANLARAAGTARASMSRTGACGGAPPERFKNVGLKTVAVLVSVMITDWVLWQYPLVRCRSWLRVMKIRFVTSLLA
jgi:hypothetical protein